MYNYLCKEYDEGENPQYAEPWGKYQAGNALDAAERYVKAMAEVGLPHENGYVEVLVQHPDGATFLVCVEYETEMTFQAKESKYVEL